ncbi:hypothetical protein Tco_0901965 [Tanacetum coccineum]
MGKVKDFASLSNLKVVLVNEGFIDTQLRYIGYWVMIKFQSEKANNMFQSNVSVGTWFTRILQASNDFIVEGRVAWVEIEGVPLKMWFENTFKRIASNNGVPGWTPDFTIDNESYEGKPNGDDLKNATELA